MDTLVTKDTRGVIQCGNWITFEYTHCNGAGESRDLTKGTSTEIVLYSPLGEEYVVPGEFAEPRTSGVVRALVTVINTPGPWQWQARTMLGEEPLNGKRRGFEVEENLG